MATAAGVSLAVAGTFAAAGAGVAAIVGCWLTMMADRGDERDERAAIINKIESYQSFSTLEIF